MLVSGSVSIVWLVQRRPRAGVGRVRQLGLGFSGTFKGIIGVILGVYRDNGKENGSQ